MCGQIYLDKGIYVKVSSLECSSGYSNVVVRNHICVDRVVWTVEE